MSALGEPPVFIPLFESRDLMNSQLFGGHSSATTLRRKLLLSIFILDDWHDVLYIPVPRRRFVYSHLWKLPHDLSAPIILRYEPTTATLTVSSALACRNGSDADIALMRPHFEEPWCEKTFMVQSGGVKVHPAERHVTIYAGASCDLPLVWALPRQHTGWCNG